MVASALSLELGNGLTRVRPCLCSQEAVHVERGLSQQHRIRCSSDLVGQDAKGLSFPVFSFQTLREDLTRTVLPQKENRRFREGPLQVYVADLRAAGPKIATAGALGAFDQPCVQCEVLYAGEAAYVVDLVEQSQSDDRPDPGNGPQTMKSLRIMHL